MRMTRPHSQPGRRGGDVVQLMRMYVPSVKSSALTSF